MKKAEIYIWTYCPFCIKAKELLDNKGIEYKEYDIQNDPEEKKRLLENTGQNTVPYVFIDGEFIGGYDDLAKLDKQGGL